MTIRIALEGPESLEQYAQVPIRFIVDRTYRVTWRNSGLSGIAMDEEPVTVPYWYDYDEFELPVEWRRWDLSAWAFLAAYEGTKRVGGAAVARSTPGLYMLEGRPNLACLWDLRIAPELRRSGIGTRLFEAASAWARDAGADVLKIETQNINVNACHFYAKQGCLLEGVHPGVYEDHPEQVHLIWRRILRSWTEAPVRT